MRIRCIKPEFWTSESVGRLSRDARLLFIGLWSFADDSGRGRGAFPAISGTLFPYDSDASKSLPRWFAELEAEGMVRRYKAEDGNTYYDLPNWLKHQKIEKPSKSKIPAFTENSPNTTRIVAEISGEDQGSGIRDQGAMEQGTGTHSDGAAAPPAAKRERERNPLFDALAKMEGGAKNLTQPTAKKVGVALSHIQKASPDVTPEEILKRASNLKLHMPNVSQTATSLASHWARCAVPPENGQLSFHQQSVSQRRNHYIGGQETWEATSGKLAELEGTGY